MSLYDSLKLTNSTAVPTFRGSAIPELMQLKQAADTNYLRSVDLMNSVSVLGQSTMATPMDAPVLTQLNADASNKIKTIADRGDLENALPELSGLATNLTGKLKQIETRAKAREEFRGNMEKSKLPQSVIDAKLAMNDLKNGTITFDPYGKASQYIPGTFVDHVDSGKRINELILNQVRANGNTTVSEVDYATLQPDKAGGIDEKTKWKVHTNEGWQGVDIDRLREAFDITLKADKDWRKSMEQEAEAKSFKTYGNLTEEEAATKLSGLSDATKLKANKFSTAKEALLELSKEANFQEDVSNWRKYTTIGTYEVTSNQTQTEPSTGLKNATSSAKPHNPDEPEGVIAEGATIPTDTKTLQEQYSALDEALTDVTKRLDKHSEGNSPYTTSRNASENRELASQQTYLKAQKELLLRQVTLAKEEEASKYINPTTKNPYTYDELVKDEVEQWKNEHKPLTEAIQRASGIPLEALLFGSYKEKEPGSMNPATIIAYSARAVGSDPILVAASKLGGNVINEMNSATIITYKGKQYEVPEHVEGVKRIRDLFKEDTHSRVMKINETINSSKPKAVQTVIVPLLDKGEQANAKTAIKSLLKTYPLYDQTMTRVPADDQASIDLSKATVTNYDLLFDRAEIDIEGKSYNIDLSGSNINEIVARTLPDPEIANLVNSGRLKQMVSNVVQNGKFTAFNPIKEGKPMYLPIDGKQVPVLLQMNRDNTFDLKQYKAKKGEDGKWTVDNTTELPSKMVKLPDGSTVNLQSLYTNKSLLQIISILNQL